MGHETRTPEPTGRPLTPWESLLKTVVEALIENLPNIIRNGYSAGGITVPAYTNVQLPDMIRFDTEQQLALCPFLSKPVANTLLTVRGNRLNGLDTIAASGEITFPEQDVQLSVPLLFGKISLTGEWQSQGECQRGNAPPTTAEHHGTYSVRYADVQVTLHITLDQRAEKATALTATLTDNNGRWQEQPDFDPAADVTFESTTTTGQRTVLTALLRSDQVRAKFRSPVKEVIESTQLAGEIKKVVNALLAQLG